MKQKFNIEGMSCSACSASVEKAVRRLDGVTRADVSLMDKSMVCEFEGDGMTEKIISAVARAGFEATVAEEKSNVKETADKADTPGGGDRRGGILTRLIVSIIFTLPLMYVSMGHMLGLPLTGYFGDDRHAMTFFLLQLLLTLPVLYVNRVFFVRGIPALFRGSANMDTLVSLGAAAAVIYGTVIIFAAGEALGAGNTEALHSYMSSLYFESAAMLLTLVTVGKTLEERAKRKTGRALDRLRDLSPKKAHVLRDGRETEIDTSDLRVGDTVILRPGDAVPADGVIIEGESSFDCSALTGESLPVDLRVGDKVMTATLNINGSVMFRATEVGDETTLAGIIRLVRDAGASKAPVARLADKISGIFVPVVLGIAALTLTVWLLCGAELGFALERGISVLVISCPCSLGLATPVAVTVAIGRSASDGVLIKSAGAIERLQGSDTVVLDKTGTLTEGRMSVSDVIPAESTDTSELLLCAASLEAKSEHPLGRAVSAYYNNEDLLPVTDFSAVFGKGVEAKIDGVTAHGGSAAYLGSLGIDVSPLAADAERLALAGKTPLYFEKGMKFLGIIAISDTLKPESRAAVEDLRGLGVEVIMLTGDNRRTAEAFAGEVGIDRIYPELLPEAKERIVKQLRDEGHRVTMVGDGINDSPALTSADVGISPAAGTDIAIDSADIILMNSDLGNIPGTISYSRRVMRNIRQNLFWAFFYNSLGIPIAAGVLYPATGLTLNPMIASAMMSLSSLFVVTNALRLYKKDNKKTKNERKTI